LLEAGAGPGASDGKGGADDPHLGGSLQVLSGTGEIFAVRRVYQFIIHLVFRNELHNAKKKKKKKKGKRKKEKVTVIVFFRFGVLRERKCKKAA
jgi:hypothetical protein